MSIVLNEKEWAENAINNRQLGRNPMETLGRVAKYYRQSEDYKKSDVRDKLENFLIQCDPGVILVRWADTLDRIAKSSDRYPLIELDGVAITDSEIEVIKSMKEKQVQRLAFTLLCVAKYWNAVQSFNNGWVNTSDKEIMTMANLKPSIQRQSLMFHNMKNAGLISFGKRVDNLNIQVNFIDDNSPTALFITDFRNLGNQWLMYIGDPFIQCSHCGITVRKKANAQKYCPDCATEIYIRNSFKSAINHYYGSKLPPS